MLALQTQLETLTNQNSDCKQHIEVLKESLTAKEQRANIMQTEVSECVCVSAHFSPKILLKIGIYITTLSKGLMQMNLELCSFKVSSL